MHCSAGEPSTSLIQELKPVWPIRWFRPHALTSGHDSLEDDADVSFIQTSESWKKRNQSLDDSPASAPNHRVFVADRFRILELFDNFTRAEPVPCAIDGAIADIAYGCDSSACRLMVLLDSFPPTVVDCRDGKPQVLLQATAAATRLAAYGPDSLFVAHGAGVVRYDISEQGKWVPSWTVKEFSKGDGMNQHARNIVGVDVFENRLVLVDDRAKVEVWELHNGKRCGSWKLPTSTVGACRFIDTRSSLLVLTSDSSQQEQQLGPVVNLLRVDLQGPDLCYKARPGQNHSHPNNATVVVPLNRPF